ncbi:hypothetical protein GS506_28690 [Rhodococcus hoagii]|nr:hypothetical protein [Prescottella equi]
MLRSGASGGRVRVFDSWAAAHTTKPGTPVRGGGVPGFGEWSGDAAP